MRLMKVISLLLLVLVVSGCSQIASPGELLHAPNRTNKEQALFQAVLPFLPNGYQLTIPSSFDQGSAIRLVDLDGDGHQELMTFYKTVMSPYEINILILHQKNGSWQKADLITQYGISIDYVNVTPVTDRKVPNLLLGFTVGDESLPKELRVYSFHNLKAAPIFEQTYHKIAAGKMDSQGLAQIAIVPAIVENMPGYKIQLFGAREGKIMLLAERAANGWVYNLQIGPASANHNALFAQIQNGSSDYTALLLRKDYRLVNIMVAPRSIRNDLAHHRSLLLGPPDDGKGVLGNNHISWTNYPFENTDHNHDGIMEVKFSTVPPGIENTGMSSILQINTFYQWDGNRHLNFVEDHLTQDVYNFRIPDRWLGQYRIQLSDDKVDPTKEIRFIYPRNGKVTADLLTLRRMSLTEWKQSESALKKKKISYLVMGRTFPKKYSAEPQVTVAILPDSTHNQLEEKQVAHYKPLLLTISDLRSLTKNQLYEPGKEKQ
ncbi:hypothetical protein [Paenibacillus wulumuqiensis]|uniref:hypothetical protein n=1 Tax=Paenibacillus wulumuqiensis TaxID=1567107 RepID=UPI0006196064|nr:hypothetical protein [Paenibacillus wulumuqiensis]